MRLVLKKKSARGLPQFMGRFVPLNVNFTLVDFVINLNISIERTIMNVNVGGTKGWKNIEPEIRKKWKVLDASKGANFCHDLNAKIRFPMPACFVDNYYTSHTLEHVVTPHVPYVMAELYRTLKVDGKIRIVVPNIHVAVQMYLNDPEQLDCKTLPAWDKDMPPTALGHLMCWWETPDRGKHQYYSGHKTAFDWETLHYYLRTAGFKEIKCKRYSGCSPVFEGLDNSRYKDWSLFVEAEKRV